MTTPSTNTSPSKIYIDLETYQIKADQSLCKMVSPEDLKRATRLTTNYFEPSLWRELTQIGAHWHHEFLLHEKIAPGHLWIQNGLEGAIIHWSEGKTIHRASLFENQVLLVSYSIEMGVAHTIRTSMQTEALKELLHSYLEKVSPLQTSLETPKWDDFVKKLELVKIDCAISQVASQKFIELDKTYPGKKLGACVLFQVMGKNNLDNPFIEVSKRALTTCIKQTIQTKDAGGVIHSIGPTLRSFEALEQVLTQAKNGVPLSDGDRAVINLKGKKKPMERKMEDLKPVLHIKTDGKATFFPFKIKIEKSQIGEPKFLIAIDYSDEKWVLESTFYQ